MGTCAKVWCFICVIKGPPCAVPRLAEHISKDNSASGCFYLEPLTLLQDNLQRYSYTPNTTSVQGSLLKEEVLNAHPKHFSPSHPSTLRPNSFSASPAPSGLAPLSFRRGCSSSYLRYPTISRDYQRECFPLYRGFKLSKSGF